MKYHLIVTTLLLTLIMSGCTTHSNALFEKSDAALRNELNKSEVRTYTVLTRVEKSDDSIKSDIQACGVTVLVATTSIITITGTKEQLECVASKHYVLNLELSKTRSNQ